MAAPQRGYSRPRVQGRAWVEHRCGSRRSRFIVLEVSSLRQVSRGPNQGVSLAVVTLGLPGPSRLTASWRAPSLCL